MYQTESLHRVNAQIDEICLASGVPGASIGVIHKGKVVHTYNYGKGNVEDSQPTASDTVYGIGSITKSFIAVAMARLVQDGKLHWHTTVREILPGFQQKNQFLSEMMTITDILSHRCGLAGLGGMNLAFQGDGDMLLPKDRLIPMINNFDSLFPFRQDWSYFVWGYSLAGLIIEEVTKKTLEEFLSDSIFHPLGFESTTMSPELVESAKLSRAYAGLSGGRSFLLPKRQEFKDTFFQASGGMYSSLNDMIKWAFAMLNAVNGTAPNTESVIQDVSFILSNHAAIHNPSIRERSYGIGWVRTQLPGVVGMIGDNSGLWDVADSPEFGTKEQPILMIYHQGATVGYYSFIAIFPDTSSAVVVLTNSIALSDSADWIGRAVTKALFQFDDGQDYVALAKEANRRAMAEFDDLAGQIHTTRAACTNSMLPKLSSFVGKYNHISEPFFIDILRHPKLDDQLVLRFQGFQDQSYDLRHLCENKFEWSLTHDDSKRRGRYNNAEYINYVFEFDINGQGEVEAFYWSIDSSKTEERFEKGSRV
ncbi:beta-lactamase/transpeptidase-like protein [Diaporthe sp. PMI_573]|nr:beta-lactamase/transpeptidase-like protein [Diaporthaceae sp. PMI_573]